ncbi:MAG: hypothetical protein IIZ87_03750, partial [Selenomonas sp.]|nr:hypothetical protein [Selenomonas sp.]
AVCPQLQRADLLQDEQRSEPLLFSGGARIMRQTKTKSVIDKEKDVCRHLIMSVILWRQESAAV